MFRFLYSVFKWIFMILFCTTLLLGAGYNVPQTRDDVEKVKNFVEETWKVDLDEKWDTFMIYYDKFRGMNRRGFE